MILTKVFIIAVASFAAGSCLMAALTRLLRTPLQRNPRWAAWLLLCVLADAWIVASNCAGIRREVRDLEGRPAAYQEAGFGGRR